MTTELRNAINSIENKGYTVCTMVYNNCEYEIYDSKNEVIIDHLSEAQVVAMANILK